MIAQDCIKTEFFFKSLPVILFGVKREERMKRNNGGFINPLLHSQMCFPSCIKTFFFLDQARTFIRGEEGGEDEEE